MHAAALNSLEHFTRYLATERRVSPHTVSAYRLELAALRGFCEGNGIERWSQLEVSHIRFFAARSHARGLSPVSVQRRLSAVRSFLSFLIREGEIQGNPALVVQAPKVRRRLPNTLDADQMARLLDVRGNDPCTVRDRAIMELLYSSALRVIELVRLNCNDVDLNDRTVRVLGKGNVVRVVPVGSFAAKAIQTWLGLRRTVARPGEVALFVGRGGSRLGPRNVQMRIDYWSKRQGLTVHVHPHMFRHSCATHLLESSGSIREVQEFLGHASISTTQIYTHLDAQHLLRVYHAAHPRSGMNPAERAKTFPGVPLPTPPTAAERLMTEAAGPTPCDRCSQAARCAAQHLACTAYELFADGQPVERWRTAPRTDATADRYLRITEGEIQ